MNFVKLITDGYERKARLYPALLLLIPVIFTIAAAMPETITVLQKTVGIFATCGGIYLTAQLARDPGKNKEASLYVKWGGMPSVVILRHADQRIDPITKGRYHKKLTTLVKGTKGPSPNDEIANPAVADQTYTAWSTYLRTNTRDTKRYFLLFQELTNFGYRRTVWGLRTFGVSTTGLLSVGTIGWNLQAYLATGSLSERILIASLIDVIFLILWMFVFSTDWVRLPADAYAARLAETVDTLTAKSSPATKTSSAK